MEILSFLRYVSGPHCLGVVDRHFTDAYRPSKSFLSNLEKSAQILHGLNNQLDGLYRCFVILR